LALNGIDPSDEPKFAVADILSAMEKAKGMKAQAHCLKAVDVSASTFFHFHFLSIIF
jgi:hypothetical protein